MTLSKLKRYVEIAKNAKGHKFFYNLSFYIWGFFITTPKQRQNNKYTPSFLNLRAYPFVQFYLRAYPTLDKMQKLASASSINYNFNAISSTLSAHSPSITEQEIKTDFFLQKSTKQTQLYLPSHPTIITNLLFKLNKHNLFLLKKWNKKQDFYRQQKKKISTDKISTTIKKSKVSVHIQIHHFIQSLNACKPRSVLKSIFSKKS